MVTTQIFVLSNVHEVGGDDTRFTLQHLREFHSANGLVDAPNDFANPQEASNFLSGYQGYAPNNCVLLQVYRSDHLGH